MVVMGVASGISQWYNLIANSLYRNFECADHNRSLLDDVCQSLFSQEFVPLFFMNRGLSHGHSIKTTEQIIRTKLMGRVKKMSTDPV